MCASVSVCALIRQIQISGPVRSEECWDEKEEDRSRRDEWSAGLEN